MPRITPLNQALILINVVVFLLQQWLGAPVELNFALFPPEAAQYNFYYQFHFWQLLTYGFMHASWLHLFSNMFGIWMFGSQIEQLFGSKRYLIYYLACVVGAAVAHLLMVKLTQMPPAPLVGASGGVFGLLLAFGMAYPRQMILLIFPPIPMPAWLFVTLYGIFELVMGVTQTASGVAHFAHLGGMATGFILIHYWTLMRRRRR